MKKILLSMVAMFAMSASTFAQEVVSKYSVEDQKAEAAMATKAPVAVANVAMVEADFQRVDANAPRMSYDDGVYYQRPVGALYVSNNGTSRYCYHYIPGLIDVTWKNMAEDKANSKWSRSYTSSSTGELVVEDAKANEDGDYVETMGLVSNGYISSYYIPTLTVGEKDYKFTYTYANGTETAENSQTYLINGDSVMSVSQANKASGYWTGFSDGHIFGTGDRNVKDGDETVPCYRHSIIEVFQKPFRTLYLSSIWFHFISDATEKGAFLPEGKEMKVHIWKVNEKGSITNELLEDLTFTVNDTIWCYESYADDGTTVDGTYGAISIAKKEMDDFGTEYEVPILLDDAFAIEIEGFDQEGVEFSTYMVDVMGTPTDYVDNGGFVRPTLCTFSRQDNGEMLNDKLYYVQYISSTGENAQYARQYNAGIHLNCMYDIVNVLDGFDNMTAPVEGGAIYMESEEENEDGDLETVRYSTVQFESTLPRISTWEGMEGDDNYTYTFDGEEECEWLHVGEANDSYFEDYNVTLQVVEADPLPEGVAGRRAIVNITSERGAKSQDILVVQGEDPGPANGIVSLKDGMAKKTNKVYNLAGQQVNSQYKGIVIANGKKVVK